MPIELAQGMLGNKAYQAKHSGLRQDQLRLDLQQTGSFKSQSDWFNYATGLIRRDGSGGPESLADGSKFSELFQEIRLRREAGFETIWKEARPRLEEYREKFQSRWRPISDRVIASLSALAKMPWRIENIQVHFVDCLYGGFGWKSSIGFAAFPDMEVQKKFLAHELSELITPQRIVIEHLQKEGLNPEIAHTVVDMLAYFSVRDFIAKPVSPQPERKGIRPNSNYYPNAEELFPIFDRYSHDPSEYPTFAGLVQDIIQTLRKPKIAAGAAAN